MKKRTVIKKFGSVLVSSLLVAGLLTGCGGNSESKDSSTASTDEAAGEEGSDALKVALVLNGSKSDGSWNGGAYDGLNYLAENRDDLETTYVENVSADDAKLAIENLIDEGNKVIIAFAGEYSDVVDELATEHEDVYFLYTNTSAEAYAPNVAALNSSQGEGAFLVGVIAASLSETGKVGSVEGFDFGVASDNYLNFVAGAEYINPDIEVVDSFVGSWTDVEKAKSTALAQVESGVDFIYASGDAIGTGIIAGAEEADIPVIGYGGDLNELAPNNVISTVQWNTGITFNLIIDSIADGTFESGVYESHLADGSITLADYHGLLDEETQNLVEEVKEKIINGEIETIHANEVK